MSRHLQSDAVILKSTRMGDSHRIVVLMSPELGIVRAAAFGSRKGTGKLAGMVNPHISGRFFLYHNPVKDQYKIEDIKPYAFREYLQKDLIGLYSASFFSEVVLKSFGGGGDNRSIYDLLNSLLDLVEHITDHEYLLIQGCMRFLDIFGLMPDLEECASCGRSFGNEPSWLHISEHGLWCADCFPSHYDMMEIGIAMRKYLSYTWSLPLEKAVQVRLEKAQAVRLKQTLLQYMDSITGGYLNTLKSGIL